MHQYIGVIVHDPYRGLLLTYRDGGWLVPSAIVAPGESAQDAAIRATTTDTGWQPGPLRELLAYRPLRTAEQRYLIWQTDSAEELSHHPDAEWLAVPRLREMCTGGQLVDGLSLTAVLRFLATRGR